MTIYRNNCECFKRNNWPSSQELFDLRFISFSSLTVITLGHLTHFVNISFQINVKEIDLGHCARHHNVTKIDHFDIHQKPSMVYQEQSWADCICIHLCVFLVFVYFSQVCVSFSMYVSSLYWCIFDQSWPECIWIHFSVFLVFVNIWQVWDCICIHFCFFLVFVCIWQVWVSFSTSETSNIGNYEHYSQYGDCTICVGKEGTMSHHDLVWGDEKCFVVAYFSIVLDITIFIENTDHLIFWQGVKCILLNKCL